MPSRTRPSSRSDSASPQSERKSCRPGSSSRAIRMSRRSTSRRSATTEARWTSARSSPSSLNPLLHFGRNVSYFPGDDVGADLVDRGDLRLRHLRADLADADAVLLQAEDQVAALEVPVDDALDRQEDRGVDPLDRTGQDVRAEEGLVGVDTDSPDSLLLRSIERTEAAAAGNLEDHACALLDLVQGHLLALRLVGEVF